MVAKITVPSSIEKALNYNEQKTREQKAECIYAHNFLKSTEKMNFYDKLHRFERLIQLNERVSTNAVHVSLNFGPNEKIEKDKLTEIASVYMEKIGFGNQPYLVYQHVDTGHPHIHIVTTNIQQNGKRISLHNIGRKDSAKARKEIEIQFNLVKAGDHQKITSTELIPMTAQKITYGKAPIKRAITNILDAILPHYKYSSLHELNAILGLYNVKADRGNENGIVYNKKGLLYRVLDDKGNYIGVPIKASSIYNQPTLKFLEKKFLENDAVKLSLKKQIKTKLDWILVRRPQTFERFKEALEKENISLVIRQNENGIVYGLTYIDHSSKTVFNGSDIGKAYSAKGILETIEEQTQKIINPQRSEPLQRDIRQSNEKQTIKFEPIHSNTEPSNSLIHIKQDHNISKALESLISNENNHDYLPYELRKLKKKRKRNKR